jgi:hypothetical protein
MKPLVEVAAVAALVGIETLVAALILAPGGILRRASRMLRAAGDHTAAAVVNVRDRLRRFMRPRGPRFRPPRYA